MSSLFRIFNTSGSALTAQSTRLNTIASNMANANTAASSLEDAYRPKQVLFETVMDREDPKRVALPVRVAGIVDENVDPFPSYEPNHPRANEDGYIFRPSVNMVEEMANMMSASRSYEANVETMNTTRQLLQQTLRIGKG